jgi:hypothetical protein
MEGYYVTRTYTAGMIEERIKFHMPGEKPPKSKRKMQSDIKKVKQNAAEVTRKLARIINENFRSGYLIGLDYSPDGYVKLERWAAATQSEQENDEPDKLRHAATHEFTNYIRRVKDQAKKAGVEVKYVAITSDMDRETGEAVRIHHHLVINAEALPFFLKKWTAGGVQYEKMSDQPDYTPIAVYFINQVRKVPDEKSICRLGT